MPMQESGATSTYIDPIVTAYRANPQDPTAKANYTRRKQELKDMGLSWKTAPYEQNQEAYQNPYLSTQLADIAAGKEATTSQIAGMAVPQQEFRNTQSSLIGQLQAAANGEGPSVVQQTYRKAVDDALSANKASTLSSNLNPAMAARMNASGVASTVSNAARDAATLKAQEQVQARGELANVAQQARTQDITLASNQQNYLNDMTKYYMSLGMTQENAQFQANMDLDKARQEEYRAAQDTESKRPKSSGVLGSILGGVASLGSSAIKAFA